MWMYFEDAPLKINFIMENHLIQLSQTNFATVKTNIFYRN